jgi:hypothetical protein
MRPARATHSLDATKDVGGGIAFSCGNKGIGFAPQAVPRALSLVDRTTQRYRLGAAFSSPSPIVLITVLYFSAITVFQALVERFAFLDYANSLQDVGYLFGLNNDCLARCLATPSNVSQFVLGKPFANVTLSENCFPLFTAGGSCLCCQEQCNDTG